MSFIRFAAVILAGGESRRMGRDKAGLVLGGKRLIDITAEKLDLFDEVFISSGRDYDIPGCKTIEDIYKGKGPAAGILTALKAMEADALFVTACDLPFIERDTVKKICSLYDGTRDAVVLTSGGRMEPLFSVYGRSAEKYFEDALLSGELSVKRILEKMDVLTAEAEKISSRKDEFLNMNTFEDFEKIREVQNENGYK